MERLLADAQKLTGIKYDINNFADVTQAIHAIQTEMGITGTTAKEASETIEGSLKALKASWENVLVGITNPDADFDKLINELVQSAETAMKNLLPAIQSALNGVADLIAGVVPMISEKLPELITEILPILVEAGSQILLNLLTGIQQNLPQLIDTAIQIISILAQTFLTMLPQILQIGIQIIIELIKGIAQQAPTLIPQIVDCVLLIVETLIDNIDLLIDAGIELIIALAEGLIEALPRLIDKIPTIIDALVNAIIENLPKILQMGITLIIKLAEGLIKAIPQLLSKVPQIISSLLNSITSNGFSRMVTAGKNLINKISEGLTSAISKIGEIGKNLVQGLWNGLTGMGNWLKDKIRSFASGIVDNIKSSLGIHSPSTVFRDEIGKMLPQGLAIGIEADTSKALQAVNSMDKAIIDEMNKSVMMNKNGISVSGINGTVNQMLTASSKQDININSTLELDGEKIYENQQQVSNKKELQYAFT